MVVFLPGNCVSVPSLCDAPIQNYYMCGTTWSVWLRDQEFMSLCNCILCVCDYELCICDVCPCYPHPSGGPWCSTLDPATMWSRNQAAARPRARVDASLLQASYFLWSHPMVLSHPGEGINSPSPALITLQI